MSLFFVKIGPSIHLLFSLVMTQSERSSPDRSIIHKRVGEHVILQKTLLLALHLNAVEFVLVAGVLNVHEQLVLCRVDGVRLAV